MRIYKITFFIMPIYLMLAIIYNFIFFREGGGNSVNIFHYGMNIHDHLVYIDKINSIIKDGNISYEMNNDLGISLIYILLENTIFRYFDLSYNSSSLIFNFVIFIFTYYLFGKVCEKLEIKNGRLLFFANLSFIYFLQLVNKDILTIFIFIFAIYISMEKKYYWLIILSPIFFLVRQQLFIFIAIFLILSCVRQVGICAFFIYVITSLGAGYLTVHNSVIGAESLGNGLSAYLISFNKNYFYSGYLIFNPLRVMQFIWDLLLSFSFIDSFGNIDTAKLLRLPIIIFFIYSIKYIKKCVTSIRFLLSTPLKPTLICIIAYLLAWLMNPTVNSRYVMLIAPVMILAIQYIKCDFKRK